MGLGNACLPGGNRGSERRPPAGIAAREGRETARRYPGRSRMRLDPPEPRTADCLGGAPAESTAQSLRKCSPERRNGLERRSLTGTRGPQDRGTARAPLTHRAPSGSGSRSLRSAPGKRHRHVAVGHPGYAASSSASILRTVSAVTTSLPEQTRRPLRRSLR